MESSFLIPLLLLCISAGIGVLIRQSTKQSEKLSEQSTTLARVEVTVTSTVARVDDLHRWKNQLQEREAQELRRTIESMRRERGLEEAG
jgi:hypothetical protein